MSGSGNGGTAVDDVDAVEADAPKKGFQFPSAITVLAIVTFLVWLAAMFIPAGRYDVDDDGAPIAGTFTEIDSPLSFGDRLRELILSPINGFYGIQDLVTGFVSTENAGILFGSIGVIVFILALGSFISVVFATKSLEVAIANLADRLRSKGWLLIASVMVLFSALGSTMGFSVETFAFYPLLIPLMAALGYDRMTTAAMIVIGCLTGAMASTVNPFSIGVASGEAGVSIGEGIALRLILWVVLTALAVFYVVRYGERVRRDPSKSLVGFDDEDRAAVAAGSAGSPPRLSRVQKAVLALTGGTFLLLIFSVIPWSSLFGPEAAPADYDVYHEVAAADPFWFQLDWWFAELAMLFFIAAIVVGIVARMGERKLVGLITQGAADMIGPALVIALARGVAVIMTNTETLDTVLNTMERAVDGTSAGFFTIVVAVVNMPLAVLIPSSSGHATLAMPLIAPLSDFAGVSRPLSITAYQMGHGFALLLSPTNVTLIAGLALAKVGYDKYLRFVWPLALSMLGAIVLILLVAAGLE